MHTIQHSQFGQLSAIQLKTTDGAEATITLFGAHVVSWTPAHDRQRLFCSALSVLDGTKSIRGGIPVVFPQFAARGDGLRHGFARICTWRLLRSGTTASAAFAEFALNDADLPPAIAAQWPHPFALLLRVTLTTNTLHVSLHISNTGAAPFPFASALHSYWQVGNVANISIAGLQETRFSDYSSDHAQSGVQREADLRIAGKLDRVYHQTAGEVCLHEGDAQLHLRQHGFADAVVWNPGVADTATLSDLADDEYQRFICIESVLIDPCQLAPGAQWQGDCYATTEVRT
jgi:glucose-6-phosphate 1-epimerase